MRDLDIEWKNFPLEQVNSKQGKDWKLWDQGDSYPSRGLLAFKASEAARRQGKGKYTAFVNRLLAARHAEGKDLKDRRMLLDVAREVGLDGERMERDLADPGIVEGIAGDYEQAEKRQIFGTPTLVFDNGEAAFVKLQEIPESPEAAEDLFGAVRHMVYKHPTLLEVKKPEAM